MATGHRADCFKVMGVAEPGGSGDSARWRVFVSHTSELRDFPKGTSYVAEVERAIAAAGHVIVDMADFAAADEAPARLCAERVRDCDVYVGVLGTRYGSPVRGRPEVSYTELEFDTATEAGLDRLMFLLDTAAADVGIPLAASIDREFGDRQDAFRRRVRESGLTTQSFANPAKLGQLVERSLRELADTRRRERSGIEREQIPAEPQPVRASKFVNPPPALAPTWFQDRQVETGLLAKYVTDPGIALVIVAGRGGIGKTAMVCRLLKELEAGRIPDVEGGSTPITVGGIVYLSSNGVHQVEYLTLVADLLRLVPAAEAQRLRTLQQDPHQAPAAMMLALLEAFPAGEPVVVLLDNLESVMDAERETLADQALSEALGAVLTAPAHAVTVIATTRVMPTALVKVEPSRQRQLRMELGLGSPDAQIVLRELDDDGRLGLRDAPDELLGRLRLLTLGFPRALEAVKAILDGDGTLTPADLLDRTGPLPEDQVVQVLVGEAYDRLDGPAQQVMQALSVYPYPVSAVGVDFLLRPVKPTTDAAPILTRLVRRQLVRFQDRHYYLHPVDREYARGQLLPGGPGDSPAAFTLCGLQARAADYYSEIRTPRESWRTLEDIRPQLAEFELRCDTGDYDTAATVLNDIDADYLQVWGYYRTAVGLHGRIHGRITDPVLNGIHLTSLGYCHYNLDEYQQAIDLYTEALAIDRRAGNRRDEAVDLAGLGNCHYSLDDFRQAIELYTQALAIARDMRDRRSQGAYLCCVALCHLSLGDYPQVLSLLPEALAIARDKGDREFERLELDGLGQCHHSLGDYRRAIELHTQSLAICRDISHRLGEGTALGGLGRCHFSLGDYQRAIDLDTEALAIARDIGNRRGEGTALSRLGRCHYSLGDPQQAIDLYRQALAIARDIGDRNGEANALCYLGLACLASNDARQGLTLLEQVAGITDATGDIEPAVKAQAGLARAHLQLGDPAAALAALTERPPLPYAAEEPTISLLHGLALLGLDRVDKAKQAFSSASAAAEALLAQADHNVAALQARALALSGLAAATADPARAAEAAQAFAHARIVTTAPGIAADTRRLLDAIAAHDRSGILAEARAAQAL
jgi:tetratricopeptide (TPR) repeat protein